LLQFRQKAWYYEHCNPSRTNLAPNPTIRVPTIQPRVGQGKLQRTTHTDIRAHTHTQTHTPCKRRRESSNERETLSGGRGLGGGRGLAIWCIIPRFVLMLQLQVSVSNSFSLSLSLSLSGFYDTNSEHDSDMCIYVNTYILKSRRINEIYACRKSRIHALFDVFTYTKTYTFGIQCSSVYIYI